MTMFAIITFRDEGPLKNWQAIRAANVHNARTQPLAHAMPDAPRPKHLVGTGNLERDVKRQLRATSIDPTRLRKNGVIAYEAILTASAAFFDAGTPEERKKRLDAWTKVQVDWAMKRYGAHRVVSMVLHEDEKVPHVHLIVLPLDVKSDKRCTDKDAMRWKLVGRTISGPGRFDEAQDAYSEAMVQFGLVRGVKGSGRKHEPVPVYLARMAAKEAAVDDAQVQLDEGLSQVAADRARNAQDRSALDAAFANLDRALDAVVAQRERVNAGTIELDAAKAAHAATAAAQLREIDEGRQRLVSDRQAADAHAADERRKIAEERATLDREKAEHAEKVAAEDRRIAADREMVRMHLENLAGMECELQHDMDEQRAETLAIKKERVATALALRGAETDRAAAAVELAAIRDRSEKLKAHTGKLAPTFRAARDFRQQIAALKGQALSPAASTTRMTVDALARAAAAVTPPAHEARPDMIAHYAYIQRQGAGLR